MVGKRMGYNATDNSNHKHKQLAQDDKIHSLRSLGKRKHATPIDSIKSKSARKNEWHENDDEDSSSNDASVMKTPQSLNDSKQQPNNATMLFSSTFNTSFCNSSSTPEYNNSNATNSPRPVYTLRLAMVNGVILRDLKSKPWRLGKPIGKGNFGEIFLASDNINLPVTNENAKYVVKIEPHSNGPLFVEIHCLMNTAIKIKSEEEITEQLEEIATSELSEIPPSGIPDYIASGSHYFENVRYRFLVLPRFDHDLHSLIKNTRVHQKSLLTLAINIVSVLENLHDRGYCHNDIKAQNLMISRCKYLKKQIVTTGKTEKYEYEKQQTTDSGNSSEQEANYDDFDASDNKFIIKQLCDDDEDEDFDDGATTNSTNSNSMDLFQTPVSKKHRINRRKNKIIEFSGSNPVRSCRREKRHSIYEEMVKSHYLRPTKRISYSVFFDDGVSIKEDSQSAQFDTSDDDTSDEFIPGPVGASRRSNTQPNKKRLNLSREKSKRLVRHQEKLENRYGKNVRSTRRNNNTNNTTPAANIIHKTQINLMPVEEQRIFLIDFGLASKYVDRGMHRPFIMDQRRAHDGTLEFTSRDAHLGAHSRRSDLECLGYNLIYWSQGYLPWKDAAMQQQQEKVHRSKEILMTDVREMLKQIYGKQVPKYLGEFLHQVSQLGYQERPNYERYRNIFKREYQQLGYDCNQMQLNSNEIVRTCERIKGDISGVTYDIFELNNSVIKNPTLDTPFQEHSLSNRISPKNLRSKSSKKNPKKKKFSWTEVLSQDPDQIARERTVKEFEREEDIYPLQSRQSRQYDGNPTYAIMQIQQRLRSIGRSLPGSNNTEDEQLTSDQDDDDNEEQTDDNEDDEEENEQQQNIDDTESEQVSSEDEQQLDQIQDGEEDDEEDTDDTDFMTKSKRTSKRKTVKKLIMPNTGKTQRTRSKGKNAVSNSVQFNTKTRSTALKPEELIKRNKRGSATHKGNLAPPSAAGEINIRKPELRNRHELRERRTRRCLNKTEAFVNGATDEDSNSNFTPNLQDIYKIWSKFGSTTTTPNSRHNRK